MGSLLVLVVFRPSLSDSEKDGAIELAAHLVGLLLLLAPLLAAYGAASLPTPLVRRATFTILAAVSGYLLILAVLLLADLTLAYDLQCLSRSLSPETECRVWAKARDITKDLWVLAGVIAVALPFVVRRLRWFGAQQAVQRDGPASGGSA
ncbi:MAG: hypothetical protein ACREXY_21370, partial [Gammaproteobacteria bacterium]